MGYAFLIAGVFAIMAFVLAGEALAIGVVLWSGIHLARHRPFWYVNKMLKGGAIGALAGLTVALAIILPAQGALGDAELFLLCHLLASGFGWAAVAPARWYYPYRLEASGAPL